MLIRAVRRRLAPLAALAVVAGALVWAFAGSASAAGGTQVPNSALPASTTWSPGTPFSSGQTLDVSIPANSVLTPGAAVNILECSDPGGQPANDATSIAQCDGNTIQGDTVLVNSDGSVNYSNYTVYALPDLHSLGESSGPATCNQTNWCNLYIGQDQNDFTRPFYFSQPFLVTPNATDNGSYPGDGSQGATVGTAFSYTIVPMQSGAPVTGLAKPTLTVTGLPGGIRATANSDDTATVAGTPTVAGFFNGSITFHFVQSGVHFNVVVSLPIGVSQAPSLLGVSATLGEIKEPPTGVVFAHNHYFSVEFRTKGFPIPQSITEAPNPSPPAGDIAGIPANTSFVNTGSGVAILAGIPLSKGVYSFIVTASNGIGTPASSPVVLTIS